MLFTLSQFVFGWRTKYQKNKGRMKTNNDNEDEEDEVAAMDSDVVDEADSASVRIVTVYLWTKKNCLISGDCRSSGSLVKLTISFL
jgi:hypothetical protein